MFIKNWTAAVDHGSLGAGICFDCGSLGLVTSNGSDWGLAVQVVCEHGWTFRMAERFRGAAQSAVIDGRSRSWRRRFTVERLTYFGLLVFGRSQTRKGSLNVDEIRARLLLAIVDRPAKQEKFIELSKKKTKFGNTLAERVLSLGRIGAKS